MGEVLTKTGHRPFKARISLFRLAPLFGACNAVAMTQGLGTLPWGTTGHVVTISFMIGDVCVGNVLKDSEKQASIKAAVMIVAMIMGAICGAMFSIYADSNVVLDYT